MFRKVIGFTLSKENKIEYLEMFSKHDYVAIGKKYGKAIYIMSVGRGTRRKILKKYAKENRVDEICELYSKRKIRKAKKLEKQYAKYKANNNRLEASYIYGIERILSKKLIWIAVIMYFLSTPLMTLYIHSSVESSRKNAEIEYAKEIDLIDRKFAEYGSYIFNGAFCNQDFGDLTVINKLMYDMWANIEGYGTPEMDIIGVSRLDIVSESGVGVCRNMADYMAEVMSHQVLQHCKNPRMMYVDMENCGNNHLMNITRRIISTESEMRDKSEKYNSNGMLKKYAANHVIVAVDFEDELSEVEFTLLIDPTNPGYGYLKNGKIMWINSMYDKDGNLDKTNPLSYNYKKRADFELNKKHMLNTNAIISSYFISEETEDYIWSHFDLKSQQIALEEVKTIDDHDYISEVFFHGAYCGEQDF